MMTSTLPSRLELLDFLASIGAERVPEGAMIPEGVSFKLWRGESMLRIYFLQNELGQRFAIDIDEDGRVERLEVLRKEDRRETPR